MCDGMKLLPSMIKRDPVKCLGKPGCWCFNVHTRFPHSDDQCLSPAELLASSSALLCAEDKTYLERLAKREFIPLDNNV